MSASPSFVPTTVNYSKKPAEGISAYMAINLDPKTGLRDMNFTQEGKEVLVENVRGKEDLMTLDTSGFQFYNRATTLKSFVSDEEIKRVYYPENEKLLKELTGATKVFIFDHTVRRVRPGQIDDSPSNRQPEVQAHIDQSADNAVARVRGYFPDEAPELLKRRFQVINLWRPIEVPALEWPLALCDYRSVDPKNDVYPVWRKPTDREALFVQYNPNHKWKYLRGMTPDEIVLIKCFDSLQDGSVAIFVPHTAFVDPTTPKDAPHRQSIEIRAFVFYG